MIRQLIFSLLTIVLALAVLPAAAHATTYTNPAGFASPVNASNADGFNPFDLYPTQLQVSGTEGAITDVDVTLHNANSYGVFNYSQFLLVSPDGTGVTVLSRAGGALVDATLVVDQQATESLGLNQNVPPTGGVRVKPSAYVISPDDPVFPPPAVVPADIAPDLNRLNGRPANGTWKLWANHSYSGGGNRTWASGGWSLDIQTTGDITAPAFTRPAVSGRTIGFDLSEASSIQFRVDRISKGVKVKSKCVAPKKGRKGKSCSRYVPLPGAIDTIGVAGINSFAWNGRIGNKKLAPDKYRLTGTAKDAAGNQSPPQTFTVTIKKPKKKKKS